MKYLSCLRRKSFWLLDFIKGGKIKKHFLEIASIQDNPFCDSSKRIKNTHLQNLLSHATTSTLFYSKYKSLNKLSEFPVIRKTVIQNNFDAFKSKDFIAKNSYKVSTSGSTGVSFFLFQNKNKRQRNTADVIYFSKQSGFNLGNRLYELEVWREHNKKSILKSWIQNVIQFDISKLTDNRILDFIKLLKNSKQEKNILGFASSYEQICKFLDRSNLQLNNLNINSIIANSEYLNEYTKSSMSKYFNTAVLSRYSSEEIGIIAQQTLKSQNQFVINHASYAIELLDLENDEPAKYGAFGRIVVTDLFNYSMPIIRYDTGDIAKFGKDKNGNICFEKIEGRMMDLIYDTKGNIVSSFVVYTKFYKYYSLLKQYQFIQKGVKDYEIKLNIHDKFPFEKELINSVKKDFGEDATVTIIYVNEIPALSSGKRKKVVNTYHTNLGAS